jgi:hypothetical protein
MSSSGQSIDHIIFKCSVFSSYPSPSTESGSSSSSSSRGDRGGNRGGDGTEADMMILREELRSTILRLCLLDAQLPRLPEGLCNSF